MRIKILRYLYLYVYRFPLTSSVEWSSLVVWLGAEGQADAGNVAK